ncbi:MAG TPA: hypothetical protein VGB95_03870 [Chitinophagales bacterium]
MSRESISIKRKALQINLENSIYGTFAEIGAGQEVARTFFQAGGASGTVAKTMSAYDMAFSDSIYGEEQGGRYVSESRLYKMLQHEFELLQERLKGEKYAGRRFFTFADTCSVSNFLKTNDPHAWLGLRFQLKSGGEYNDVILHLRLKERDSLVQQKVIGAIGVNLIYACYWYANDIDTFIDSLMDNVSNDQVEIDLLKIKGPDFDVDNRLLALNLVKKRYTSATIFSSNSEIAQPKDFLYKKNVLCLRSRFRPFTKLSEDMLKTGEEAFTKILPKGDNFVTLSELTIDTLMNDENETKDFLDRAELLCKLGHTVIVSNCYKHDKLVSFFQRCRVNNLGLIVGVMNLKELFTIENPETAPRDLLAYFGNVFANKTYMIAYPFLDKETGEVVCTKKLKVPDELQLIYQYLLQNKWIVDAENYHTEYMNIFSDKIVQMILDGNDEWRKFVPQKVEELICQSSLFNYCKLPA